MSRSVRPPMIPGVTESNDEPRPGLSTLLAALAGRGGDRGSAIEDIRRALSLLQKAADKDERMGPRLVKVIDELTGMTDENDRDMSSSDGSSSAAIGGSGPIKTPA